MKRGSTIASDVPLWLILTLIVIVVVLVFGIQKVYLSVNNIFGAIPSFNEIYENGGVLLIGVDLSSGKLRMYDGTNWYDLKERELAFSGNKIETDYLRNELLNYYISTERKPKFPSFDYGDYVLEVFENSGYNFQESFDSSIAINNYKIPLVFKIKEPFAYSFEDKSSFFRKNILLKTSMNYGLYSDDSFYILHSNSPREIVRKTDLPINEMKRWRDQILKNGEFEKFLVLKSQNNEVKFRVERIDNYLFFDLRKQVSGEVEKYFVESSKFNGVGDSEIGKLENYEFVKDVSLRISFARYAGYTNRISLVWDGEKWVADGIPMNLVGGGLDRFKTSSENVSKFSEGLLEMYNKKLFKELFLSNEISVWRKVGDLAEEPLTIPGTGWSKLEFEELNKIVEFYNSGLKKAMEINSLKDKGDLSNA